jgi:hypothetical protein
MKNYYLNANQDLVIYDTDTKDVVILERLRVRVVTLDRDVHMNEPSLPVGRGVNVNGITMRLMTANRNSRPPARPV